MKVYLMSLELVKEAYIITSQFPKTEQHILVSQIRRASVSVCSNIAEGASRISKKEKRRFYEISRSSLVEIDSEFEIAFKLLHCRKEQIANF
ncbi:MAG: four helix bundle protein [Chitinophagaceae bacterium]|nr:four helix bundle protein [Chitinophagaceae bacterium]